MSRNALPAVLVAVLVILALAVAAGSLAGIDGEQTGSHGDARGSTTDLPTPNGSGPVEGSSGNGDSIGRTLHLRLLLVLGLGVLGVAYAAVPSRRRTIGLTGLALAVAVTGFVTYRPDAAVRVPTLGTSPVASAAGVVAFTGALVAGWYLLRGDRDPESLGPEPTPPASSTPDATTSQPHPADRPASDPVHRAWQRMVRGLDLSAPASRTPGEFASAAIEAGRDADAVRRLTHLFERVRYGDDDPSDHATCATELATRAEADP
ncbi:DUF4129 domain-containing protein [Haloarchaeobius sp. DT45]|uniref:DUF4129 domain-containing protein n=1 Tax=Haloarchaeobius sp. DT45 TaxID=3446116 RepID=UPI003F6BBDCE